MPGRKPNLYIAFWEKVLGNGCWEWHGKRITSGYGMMMRNRKHILAHRLSYELAFSPIPKGKLVCHRCDNPRCIRPSHLFVGTMKDNQEDMVAKGRSPKGEKNGSHKLCEENVLEIRRRYANGEGTQETISKDYNVSRTTIQGIVEHRLWRHL